MKEKYCCNQWLALVDDVRSHLKEQLEPVKPSYLVKPILNLLNYIDKYCPVCGDVLEENISSANIRVSHEENSSVRTFPSSSSDPHMPTDSSISVKQTCPACKGEGIIGEGTNGIPMACQVCYGEKYVVPKRPIDVEKLSQIETLKTKIKNKQKKENLNEGN